MDKFVGKRLDGRYEIQEIIGIGGMSVVYKARDNQENRIVAIKILKEEFVSDAEFLRRFKNESKAIAMLSHPNIVRVYDVSFGDLIQYIVMEYIEGVTLKEYIAQDGSLRWKDAVHFTTQILKALQHAHDKGIVHRDIKPQNIMVLPDGTIKVTDFGIARFARSDQRTITDKAIGSVHYISPEQARGEKTDEKADIYSLGVMLYEMITGKLPFQAESAVSVAIMQLQHEAQLPTEINGSIPKGLEQITMRAMQKLPERRYQTAAEMLCDLVAFKKDPAITFEHNYFVDNEPTKFVKSINTEPVLETEEEEETTEKSSMVPILAGVAIALILAIGILAAIFLPKIFSGTGEEIACPNFVGKSYEEILDNKDYTKNFKFKDEWSSNSDYAYGVVYEQSEKPNEKLKKGAELTLYISTGKSNVKVPDVYGKSESAAQSELKAMKFTVVIVEEVSEDVEKGYVIRTVPQRTEVVENNAKITVYVSSGKPTKNVAIGDYVGLDIEEAKKEIEKAGLVADIQEVYLSSSDKYYSLDKVTEQSPKSTSEKVPEGTKVTLSVCAGYKVNIPVAFPSDIKEGVYEIALFQDGKMVHKGNTINIGKGDNALMNYEFTDLVTKETSLTLTVTLSSNNKQYDLQTIKINNEKGTTQITQLNKYPKSSGTQTPTNPTEKPNEPEGDMQ